MYRKIVFLGGKSGLVHVYYHLFEPAHEIFVLLHCRATKAQASLCKCTDSPETSLLAYTMFGCS